MSTPKLLQYTTVLGAALAYFFLYHAPYLASPYHFQEDVVQHLLWLTTVHFDVVWADDFYPRTSAAIQPLGYRAFMWCAARFAGPVTLSRWLPLGLTVATVAYGTAFFRRSFPFALALAGGLLAAHYNFSESLGFLARAWCVPLLIAFAYYLVRGDRPVGVAACLVLAALFYPPVLLINFGILFGWAVWRVVAVMVDRNVGALRGWWRPGGVLDRRWWLTVTAGAFVAGVLVLIHSYRVHHTPGLGEFFTDEAMRWMPEFGSKGRVPFSNLRDTPAGNIWRYFLRGYLTFGHHVYLAYAMLLGALAYGFFGARPRVQGGKKGSKGLHQPTEPTSEPNTQSTGPSTLPAGTTGTKNVLNDRAIPLRRAAVYFLAFGLTTLALYAIAKARMPELFLPDRYVNYPWRWLVAGVLTVLAGAFAHPFRYRWYATLPLALGLVAWGYAYRPPSQVHYADEGGRAELYAALRALPAGSMIAGHTDICNFVPLFGHQAVLASHEQSHALYFREYYDYVTERYAATLNAFAAPRDSLDQILAFTDRYAVDYLLLDQRQLDIEGGRFNAFAPFGERYRERIGDRPPTDLALQHLPPAAVDTFHGHYLLVTVNRLR